MATDDKTIADFGEQWTRYVDNSGFYGSTDLLADYIEPLFPVQNLVGLKIGDIGSGSGRIVRMLLEAGAAHVVAVEPSDAFDVLKSNTADRSNDVTLIHGTGDQLKVETPLDLVVSLGVLHHIVDPASTVRAARAALGPGGKMLVWLYGKEGNEAYLAIAEPIRIITKNLPHWALSAICYLADAILRAYIGLCRLFPLPMRGYLQGVYGKLAPDKRRLVIYDQLNPAYAKYYTEAEAIALLEANGFKDVQTHWRHGYSWTVIGDAP
ncbi:hypothetical protein WH91_00080 [Devosia psychrophila]|uniref:Methyltransferase domain-containing protein n=1 Tax=Devosia psychrophila TaxID=728005 RepID=A0A0F5Q257_9HYPH|nr:hypothetical protein WH91_00080 [Devosia psychrophila]SFD46195.1 Methyltransferase domain-containing protein [Devosia psychrophila]